MIYLYAYSCHKQSAHISHKCEWQQLHNMFSKHKNDLDSYQCTELTVKLLTTSQA